MYRLVAGAIAWAALVPVCAADTSSIRSVLGDASLYFTAPLRWNEQNWMQSGVSIAAIAAAHEADERVRTHFAPDGADALQRTDPHDKRDWAPTAALVVGTWALATAWDDSAGYEEGRVMLEAGGLSLASATLFKAAAGRSRPNETEAVDDWRNSGDSFPSVHVSAAFAVGTVFAESGGEDYRWLRRAVGYGLATATAYARVHDNQHWLSDTVAGAALGIATAQFSLGRRDAGSHRPVTVIPVQGGAMLAYSVQMK